MPVGVGSKMSTYECRLYSPLLYSVRFESLIQKACRMGSVYGMDGMVAECGGDQEWRGGGGEGE